jgi:hypothetical protein
MVMPGDNVNLNVKLITPVALEQGSKFAIREGGLTVGVWRHAPADHHGKESCSSAHHSGLY